MKTVLSRSVKNFARILMGIVLDLYIAFGKVFIVLILPTQEHGRSFRFLVSSSISFFKDLKFLSYKSSTCLVRVTLRYFMLFVAIVKGDVFLISFSAPYHLCTGGLLIILSSSCILLHY